MEFQDLTIILKNPDGTIQIATQPHLKGKKHIECYQCKSILVFEGNAAQVKCTSCNVINGVPGAVQVQRPAAQTIDCNSCGRRNPIVYLEGIYVSLCGGCGNSKDRAECAQGAHEPKERPIAASIAEACE